MTDPVRIFGASHVFVNENLKKPFHAETVQIHARGAICQNGCGLFYVGPEVLDPADRCPDCNEVPKAHRIGTEVELVEVVVRMAFGNVRGVDFLRSLGRVPDHVRAGARRRVLTASAVPAPLPISIANVSQE